ncbi:isoprenylcysteine carboxylmethyltransferase family protein [Mycobacterium sp. 852002-51057_SCH5723018]|uniref:methyltransferase family protein n=1 Tax=Mycobacterium sp. 852002-51057_SCH5723018 TaxID=1834094 RepID=UPI000801C01A|nr:isoprenylcysteine carboxylmethyltransferase family protein [Mycobacterium sp. 852002-51057_SCH5723018]OBG21893.1 isoprenylcysteine carboxyl methyltransferase [Mycobacterium sp. 852002-51057_SCH5723018]
MLATAAADIALVLFSIFGVLGFGWRSWLQYRRTGSTGFRGVSAGGLTERLAGLGFVVALLVAVSGPILQEAKVIHPVHTLSAVWVQAVGIVVATAGIAATVYAQLEMGDSWRIGVDQRETTTLVHTGVFGRIRNPIYTAMLTFGIGIAMVTPNVLAGAGLLLLVATIEVQVRRVEEPYLLRTHGEAYRAYAASVGRFIPGVGRIR